MIVVLVSNCLLYSLQLRRSLQSRRHLPVNPGSELGVRHCRGFLQVATMPSAMPLKIPSFRTAGDESICAPPCALWQLGEVWWSVWGDGIKVWNENFVT